ncbi:MAG: virginiamycin B lyase family protein, partial [Ilumatobacteraceae bacterium]
MQEFQLAPGSSPSTITLGPDGAMWFTEEGSNRIGRLTPGGSLSEFPIPTVQAAPGGIIAGPDGNIWFTESKTAKIARLVPSSGQITEFPTAVGGAGIVVGSDGNLWLTASSANKIMVVSITGVVLNTFSVPTANAFPHGPTLGPDGNVYFAEQNGDKIGRITPVGRFTEWPLPKAASKPIVTSFGPDGRLYFTENAGNRIGRLDVVAGSIAEFPLPTANAAPLGITAGPDGNLWFAESQANRIGRITTGGAITEYSIPLSGSTPKHIASGSSGNVWFTQGTANAIGAMTPPAATVPSDVVVPSISGVATVGSVLSASPGSWNGNPAPTFGYSWERCDTGGANCASIGASGTSYTLAPADAGSTVLVSVTATNSAGSASASSSPTAVVTAAIGPTTPILDTFNRANGDIGSNWSVMRSGSFTPMNVSGNAAVDSTSTRFAWNFWNPRTFGPNCEAYTTIKTLGASDTLRLGCRLTGGGTTNYSGYVVSVTSAGAWSIIRVDKTIPTRLAAGVNQAVASGDKFAIRVVGTIVTALHFTPAGG